MTDYRHNSPVTNHSEAVAFLDGGRDRDYRKIAHETVVERLYGDAIGIRHHATHVVIFYPDGRVRLTTGGWYSVTTKARLNAFSPCRVWSTGGTWEIDAGVFGDAAQFEDGITLGADGTFQDWKASRWADRN